MSPNGRNFTEHGEAVLGQREGKVLVSACWRETWRRQDRLLQGAEAGRGKGLGCMEHLTAADHWGIHRALQPDGSPGTYYALTGRNCPDIGGRNLDRFPDYLAVPSVPYRSQRCVVIDA